MTSTSPIVRTLVGTLGALLLATLCLGTAASGTPGIQSSVSARIA